MSLLFSALLAAAALRGTVEISDRTEARLRSSYDVSHPVIDLETIPEIRITLRPPRWELVADYTPRLTLRQIDLGPQPDILQQGRLAASFRDRRATLSLYQNASYGRLYTTSLAAAPSGAGPTSLDALPVAQIIEYASSQTGLTGTLSATRRWGLSLSLEYALSGGAGPSSALVIPFQTALHGVASAEYTASRRDRVSATIDASRALFSTGWDDRLLLAKTAWRRALGRNTTSTLAGGIGWAAAGSAALPDRPSAHPVVEAGLAHRASGRLDVGISARLSPVMDRFSGRLDERLEGTATIGWSPARALSIQAYAGVARTLPWSAPGAITLVFDGASVSYRLGKLVEIHSTAWSGWMGTRGADAPPPQWSASVGATLSAPGISF